MKKLDSNKKVKDLNLELLEKYPVWTWDESEEFLEPIMNYHPLPEESNLFIRAKFETPHGRQFNGYLIGDDSFYAFGLFYENEEFIFNLNLKDMIKIELVRMLNLKEVDMSLLFPLKYYSNLCFKNNKKISGVFSI